MPIKIDPNKILAYIETKIKQNQETMELFGDGFNYSRAKAAQEALIDLKKHILKEEFMYGDD